MSAESRRITRSMKQSDNDEIGGQVTLVCDEFDDELNHTKIEIHSCRPSIAGSCIQVPNDKNDLFDVRSLNNKLHDINLTAQIELEEESARMELEARLMRNRSELLHRRSLMLRESSKELERSHCVDDQKVAFDNRDRI